MYDAWGGLASKCIKVVGGGLHDTKGGGVVFLYTQFSFIFESIMGLRRILSKDIWCVWGG